MYRAASGMVMAYLITAMLRLLFSLSPLFALAIIVARYNSLFMARASHHHHMARALLSSNNDAIKRHSTSRAVKNISNIDARHISVGVMAYRSRKNIIIWRVAAHHGIWRAASCVALLDH